MDSIISFITGIDPKIWYMAAFIVIGIAIIKMIVKGLKGIVYIVIIAVILASLGGVGSYLKNEIGISYSDGKVIIDNEDIGYKTFDIATIDFVEIDKSNSDRFIIRIKAGDTYNSIDVKSSLSNIAEGIIENLPIEIRVKEN